MQLRQTSPAREQSTLNPQIPGHVAIIMDGNGRWAVRQGLPRLAGHRAGTSNIRRIISIFAHHKVSYLTLYAFSTENWARPDHEVRGLLNLLEEVIHNETQALHQQNVRVRHVGRLDRLPKQLQQTIYDGLDLTKNNTGLTLSIAFDYGGRDEILEAIKEMLRKGISPEHVTESVFHNYLYTAGVPDPDLIIRTAGELRLSNFLLWQSAYSEYYCTSTLWPDFDANEVKQALDDYKNRRRRFGRVLED
jgi:undecaprenyl diphosphate synthase